MNLSKFMILQVLRRLGELANVDNLEIELIIVGGTIMVLEFNTRSETEDVDLILSIPTDWQVIQYLAVKVAVEYKWDVGWVNAAAQIFFRNLPEAKGKLLFSAPGIVVYRPPLELIAARKLSLTRSDKSATDWDDAEKLIRLSLPNLIKRMCCLS